MISVKAAGLREIERALRVRGTRTNPFAKAMGRAARMVRAEVRKDLRGPVLRRVTGRLSRSVRADVQADPSAGHIGVVKPRIGYAQVLFRGATITAKTPRGLVFPVGTGVGAIYRRTKKQQAVAGSRLGMTKAFAKGLESGASSLSWRRVQSVRIPPRDFLGPATERAASRVAELLGDGFLPMVAG